MHWGHLGRIIREYSRGAPKVLKRGILTTCSVPSHIYFDILSPRNKTLAAHVQCGFSSTWCSISTLFRCMEKGEGSASSSNRVVLVREQRTAGAHTQFYLVYPQIRARRYTFFLPVMWVVRRSGMSHLLDVQPLWYLFSPSPLTKPAPIKHACTVQEMRTPCPSPHPPTSS